MYRINQLMRKSHYFCFVILLLLWIILPVKNMICFTEKENISFNLLSDKKNVVMENNQLSTTVTISNTNAITKKPIRNVEFVLYNDQNQRIGAYKTNRKGVRVIDDLPDGKYYILQTKDCGDYFLNGKYCFELKTSDVMINIKHNPIVKLGEEKHNRQRKLFFCMIVLGYMVCQIWITMKKENMR